MQIRNIAAIFKRQWLHRQHPTAIQASVSDIAATCRLIYALFHTQYHRWRISMKQLWKGSVFQSVSYRGPSEKMNITVHHVRQLSEQYPVSMLDFGCVPSTHTTVIFECCPWQKGHDGCPSPSGGKPPVPQAISKRKFIQHNTTRNPPWTEEHFLLDLNLSEWKCFKTKI